MTMSDEGLVKLRFELLELKNYVCSYVDEIISYLEKELSESITDDKAQAILSSKQTEVKTNDEKTKN